MTAPALSARHHRPPRAGRLRGALAAALLAAAAAGPAAALSNGETVHLRGTVADPQGRPIAGLAVTLSASRSYLSLRRMQSAEASARTVAATTDAQGRYALDWPWDDHYNHFELALGIPLHGAGGQGAHGDLVEPLASEDVSDRLTGAAGAAVDLPFTVRNAAYVEKVRRFAATLASDDERRVYAELGHPDEVKSVHYPDHDEVSWWYFESGKAYRFESGKLAQVVPFAPIKPF